MLIIQKSYTNKLTPTASTVIREYLMKESAISGAVAEINGRYPDIGFAVNKRSKELVYIIQGTGKIHTKYEVKEFTQGDVVFIDRGELFAWEAKPCTDSPKGKSGTGGTFTMFMVTTPTFDPKQHIITT